MTLPKRKNDRDAIIKISNKTLIHSKYCMMKRMRWKHMHTRIFRYGIYQAWPNRAIPTRFLVTPDNIHVKGHNFGIPSIKRHKRGILYFYRRILKQKELHLFGLCQYVRNCPYTSMSLVVRNPAFCICENEEADQLRGNREADQRLCFRYSDSTIPLLP